MREVRREEVGLHNILRAIPNPVEGLDEDRTSQITSAVQAMGLSFSGNEKLVQVLPVEMRFLEGALGLSTTTEVRKFALKEFCPREGLDPAELRFRVRVLLCNMDRLPRGSYSQLQV
ncbi:unnamed protein product [Discosporangium mesarthrocarpum]